jgi:cell division protein FtsX
MKLGTWLLALCEPLLARILLSLGFSIVTVTGFDLSVNAVKNQLIANVNTLPADMLNLFLVSGGGIGLGIIFGAITTRVTLWMIKNSVQMLGKSA